MLQHPAHRPSVCIDHFETKTWSKISVFSLQKMCAVHYSVILSFFLHIFEVIWLFCLCTSLYFCNFGCLTCKKDPFWKAYMSEPFFSSKLSWGQAILRCQNIFILIWILNKKLIWQLAAPPLHVAAHCHSVGWNKATTLSPSLQDGQAYLAAKNAPKTQS